MSKAKKIKATSKAALINKKESSSPVNHEKKVGTSKKNKGKSKVANTPIAQEVAPKKKVVHAKKKAFLKGLSQIRRHFYRNEENIYFFGATNFNMLGADEWIKGFKYISLLECFDGLEPNVFSPTTEIPHDQFESIEDINNYLLQHPEVQNYIKARAKGKKAGKAMFLMFNEKTEKLAKKLGLEVIFPSAKMRNFLDNKVNTNRIAEKAGVPCVPNVLQKVSNYKKLRAVSKHLGNDLVIQTPYGDSGHTTFFISNEEEYNNHADEIEAEKEVKVMRRINCRGAALEACVTRHGTIVAPLMTELVGFDELTPYEGGWCGNEIYANAFTPDIREKTNKYAQLFGNQLREEGYVGYFELDFLLDQDNGEVYLGELNPRVTGASSITNHAVFALADAPLYLFHILEYMNIDYNLKIDKLNKRWQNQENIDGWSQFVVKHTDDTIEYITAAPRSGIWHQYDNGHMEFSRMDTHRRAVESESEAFFLRIAAPGKYLYEGADMGILVTRGRMMTDDFKLTPRAKTLIQAIRSNYHTNIIEDKRSIPNFQASLAK